MENKNFRKIYLTVIWTVVLIAAIVGIGSHIGGWFNLGFWKSSPTIKDEKIFEKEDIKNINLDMDAGSVHIYRGDEFKVEYKYPENYIPKVSLKDDTLKIKQKINNVNVNVEDDCYCHIYVPADVTLNDVDLDMDLGELRVEDIKCESFSVDNDCGSVRLESVEGNKAQLVANLGEVRLKDCTFKSVKADADLGDVHLDGDFDDIDADCDLGNITIKTKKPTKDVNIHVENDLGSATVNGEKW